MRIGGQALVVSALAVAGLLAMPAPALAHNALTGSDPADGATVERVPEEVELSFLAAVDPDYAEFDVIGPDGSSVMAGDVEVDEKTVRLPVESGPAGEYELSWRVLSSDGDWVEGTIGFTATVGEEPTRSASPTPAVTSPTPSPPTPSPTPAAGEAQEDRSGPAWWVWALVALLLVAAAAGGYAGYRLRRRSAG